MSKLIRWLGMLVVAGSFVGVLAITGVYLYLERRLPSIDSLKDVRLQVPLRVYTKDGLLAAEFGEQRRIPLTLDQMSEAIVNAFIAAEDERFYTHPGVDWQGLTRAVVYLVRTGEKGPGGSTITMQVARNFFLGAEKTYIRKAKEILLALKIERELSKDEILELYLNKIFLGHRAYGVGAAAQVYYGEKLDNLTLAQTAMIAGLPKAPSRFNPIADPERATTRRNYVLGRMLELGMIETPDYETAIAAPVTAMIHGLAAEVEAPYVAEMVRAEMEARFGPSAYTGAYKVYMTIDSRLQEAANSALRYALLQYEERHGYRGPELSVSPEFDEVKWRGFLARRRNVGGLVLGIVKEIADDNATVYTAEHGEVPIDWDAISWARPYIDENKRGPELKAVSDVLKAGDVVRLYYREDTWRLAQIPKIEGALISIDPNSGAIAALTGGFDFRRSKFNRAVQAQRQPGSAFKPFIYSAALENGFTPATLINDAPVVFDDPSLEATWRPENYSKKFFGPTRMREALTRSRNLVSIRMLRTMGIESAIEHIEHFGFSVDRLPPNLSLALGSGTVTPLELATGFAVLANGGYLVEPYFLERIEDADGEVVYRANPLRICKDCKEPESTEAATTMAVALESQSSVDGIANADSHDLENEGGSEPLARIAPRVISAQNAWLMNSMLRDVVRRGTGRKAMELGRKDLGGKTGTTNDQRDAWFSGFNPTLVTTAWTGFDKLEPLGRRETGARAALPMWMEYMRVALDGVPETFLEQPGGLVSVRIDPETGRRVGAAYPSAVFETFRVEHVPEAAAGGSATVEAADPTVESQGMQTLF